MINLIFEVVVIYLAVVGAFILGTEFLERWYSDERTEHLDWQVKPATSGRCRAES